MVEEDGLACFFRDAGCKVTGVRLVIDAKRGGKSRGFGFVDFEDYESLDLALQLHNTEARSLAGKDGRLRIERARVAIDEARTREQIERCQAEEMERQFAFHAAKLNELV